MDGSRMVWDSRGPEDAEANAVGYLQLFPIVPSGPDYRRRFVGQFDFRSQCGKRPDQIVMQMKRFIAFRGNTVNVDSHQDGRAMRVDLHERFLERFARGRVTQ